MPGPGYDSDLAELRSVIATLTARIDRLEGRSATSERRLGVLERIIGEAAAISRKAMTN